jgi:glycerol-3-phosphate dehydrogenase
MTFSFIQSAAEGGAVVANYARAVRFLRQGEKVTGVRVQDRITSEEFDLRAEAVVNAAGPWAAALLQTLDGSVTSPAPKLSRAMNLVMRRALGTHACGGLSSGRFLFVVPWRHVSIIGTSHDTHEGDADALIVTRWDLESFLADARGAFPHAGFTAGDVRLIHRGLLPMVSGNGARVNLLRESAVVDHRSQRAAGLISMFGVRYTTARHTAAAAVDAVFRLKGAGTPPPCRTDRTPVAGGSIGNKEDFVRGVLAKTVEGVTPETIRRLALTYGTGCNTILQIIRDMPVLGEALGRHCSVTGAEILHAARQEAAVKLTDVLIRRTEAGSAGHPGADAIERAAYIMARQMGWDEWRTRNEAAEVEAFYRLPV